MKLKHSLLKMKTTLLNLNSKHNSSDPELPLLKDASENSSKPRDYSPQEYEEAATEVAEYVKVHDGKKFLIIRPCKVELFRDDPNISDAARVLTAKALRSLPIGVWIKKLRRSLGSL